MANYIFFDNNLEKRMGGPSTYLYNLKNGIRSIDKNKIIFIYNDENYDRKIKKFYSKIKRTLSKFPRLYEKVFLNKQMKKSKLYNQLYKVTEEDIIMFHTTVDFAKAYSILPDKCTKLLMSHSPEITSNEIVNVLKTKTKSKKYDFALTKSEYFKKFDKFAFTHADIIIFPSKEAMEPYYETCNNFDKLVDGKKIKFVATGTEKLEFGVERDSFRKQYNIPKEALVLTFIGRHNEVKGYDNFIKICNKLLNKYEDIYVLTAGVGDIISPKNDRWIDIGWTNDPGSVANASDIFILPNKRTYFDLVLIEMMSIGKTCIVSNTGGNKSMAEYSEGIIKYSTNEEAIEIIEKMYNDKNLLNKYGKMNIEAYKKNFTIEKFSNRYIKLMEEINNEKKCK